MIPDDSLDDHLFFIRGHFIIQTRTLIIWYASALRHRSVVRPSVCPKPEMPSFHLYMGPLVYPTNRDRFAACPSVRSSVRPSGEVSGHLPENALREWSEILHADISWPLSELVRSWSRSVYFPHFGATLTQWNWSNLGFPGISCRTHGRKGLKFCTMMCLDHPDWLVYGHCLLIFQILALFWLSNTGQIWGFWAFARERIEGIAWNFACWCILITFKNE